MNVLDLFVKTYSRLYNLAGLPYWVMTPFRRIVRKLAWCTVPSYLSKKVKVQPKTSIPIYVSFTSFPARINYVWQVIECMLRQTFQPEKIILWLSKEQFPTEESIPVSLRKRAGDVFEIRLVDGNLRSHKKYLYVSREYPNKNVFLIDDDLYYPTDILERTWMAHLQNPDAIICNYGYLISYNADGTPKPYKQWRHNYKFSVSKDLFFGSGGGTLFVPARMSPDLTREDLATKLTPLADDVWLNAMARKANYEIVMLDNGMILPYRIKKKRKLSTTNIEEGLNDKQIQAVNDNYGEIVFCKIN